MSFIAGAHAVVGPHGYSQAEIAEAFTAVMAPQGAEGKAIKRIHSATAVDRRSLALPIEEYANLADFGAANDTFIRVGLDLGATAGRSSRARVACGAPRAVRCWPRGVRDIGSRLHMPVQ